MICRMHEYLVVAGIGVSEAEELVAGRGIHHRLPELVADDIRGDARHVVVGPGKNFRVGSQKGDEFGSKSRAKGSADPNRLVLLSLRRHALMVPSVRHGAFRSDTRVADSRVDDT
ncbi:unnamed protein product [Prunus armeniaca]